MKYSRPDINHETHTYSVDKCAFPGVTEVLSRMYDFAGIPDAVLEFARLRGTAVHRACELHDLEVLDDEDLDPRIIPYVDAWAKFKFDTGFQLMYAGETPLVELPMFDGQNVFCGTPDCCGILTKLAGSPSAVIDRKAVAQMSRVTGLQLAGYKIILRANDLSVSLRYGVQLNRNGTYKLYSYTDVIDEAVFSAELLSYKWRQRNIK